MDKRSISPVIKAWNSANSISNVDTMNDERLPEVLDDSSVDECIQHILLGEESDQRIESKDAPGSNLQPESSHQHLLDDQPSTCNESSSASIQPIVDGVPPGVQQSVSAADLAAVHQVPIAQQPSLALERPQGNTVDVATVDPRPLDAQSTAGQRSDDVAPVIDVINTRNPLPADQWIPGLSPAWGRDDYYASGLRLGAAMLASCDAFDAMPMLGAANSTCNIDGWQFAENQQVSTRERKGSSRSKCHCCQYCDCLFHTRSEVNRHVRAHHPEKPYKCVYDDFSKASVTSGNVLGQNKAHLKEWPKGYRCTFCSQIYVRKYNHDKHVITCNRRMEENLEIQPWTYNPVMPLLPPPILDPDYLIISNN